MTVTTPPAITAILNRIAGYRILDRRGAEGQAQLILSDLLAVADAYGALGSQRLIDVVRSVDGDLLEEVAALTERAERAEAKRDAMRPVYEAALAVWRVDTEYRRAPATDDLRAKLHARRARALADYGDALNDAVAREDDAALAQKLGAQR